ncbi:MAG: hypothetical protein QQW96_03270 [Tychonema bourrellyi B0820]|nr:hypothetical protein [Tychonema bourrellyi]MDQ2096651.1 hypothetical protein [Tychonema bourrellyi B0820]
MPVPQTGNLLIFMNRQDACSTHRQREFEYFYEQARCLFHKQGI